MEGMAGGSVGLLGVQGICTAAHAVLPLFQRGERSRTWGECTG